VAVYNRPPTLDALFQGLGITRVAFRDGHVSHIIRFGVTELFPLMVYQ
jgi:hypothetical protein